MFAWIKRHEAGRRAGEVLHECCLHLGMPPKALGKSGREWILRRRWSEDPSEMRRAIYQAALLSGDGAVEAWHFPLRTIRDHEAFAKKGFEELALEEIVAHKLSSFFQRIGSVEVSALYETVIKQVEAALFKACLAWSGGNKHKAARTLGINRNTLLRKMRALHLATESGRAPR